MPLGQCQPDAPHSAHRRLLAPVADPARNPKSAALAVAEFATIRLRLLKVAARVIESATRIRIAFASACPDAATFKAVATNLRPAPT
ncbi:transposase [Sphingomonas sp. NBWT7]|uniref:transposase n=1 Tax=Sphingomonas sp. NBWT7 TaxID=2596913 RepID=UPI002155FF18|nr:transposase [Sphingomonas sp. NBWT7]